MKITINLDLDLTDLIDAINESNELSDVDFFTKMADVAYLKGQLNDALEDVKRVETDVKGLIDSKAKATIGNDWSAIKGDKFKITKSFAGSVYELTGEPAEEFIKVVKNIDTKIVDNYKMVNDGKLPDGIGINEHRTSSIRISLK